MAMAQQLSRIPNAHKEAICSASGKAAEAAESKRVEYGYARALSIDELVVDPNIDIVYVASANTEHARHCLAALRGGKHVLCEKPFTMNSRDAKEVIEEATARNLLLSDGTFSAYLPACDVIRSRLPDIGKVQHVELNKKIRLDIMNNSPIINSRVLGGGLFDGCGSYTTHMLCVIFGADAIQALCPQDIDVSSIPGPNGEVDWDTTVNMRICDATVVLTHRAIDKAPPSTVRGETGSIEFVLPRLPNVVVDGVAIDTAYGGSPFADLPENEPGFPHGIHTGLGVEAARFQQALSAGRVGPGTRELPLEEIYAMSHAMDLIRHCIPTHLHYKPRSAS